MHNMFYWTLYMWYMGSTPLPWLAHFIIHGPISHFAIEQISTWHSLQYPTLLADVVHCKLTRWRCIDYRRTGLLSQNCPVWEPSQQCCTSAEGAENCSISQSTVSILKHPPILCTPVCHQGLHSEKPVPLNLLERCLSVDQPPMTYNFLEFTLTTLTPDKLVDG